MMCRGGCGVFADPEVGEYCLDCFQLKHAMWMSLQESRKAAAAGAVVKKPADESAAVEEPAKQEVVDMVAGPETPPRRKEFTRCDVCRKRVGLTAVQCRCGGKFCALHRYSNEHNCTFDYHSMGAEEIRRNNPVVRARKVPEI